MPPTVLPPVTFEVCGVKMNSIAPWIEREREMGGGAIMRAARRQGVARRWIANRIASKPSAIRIAIPPAMIRSWS